MSAQQISSEITHEDELRTRLLRTVLLEGVAPEGTTQRSALHLGETDTDLLLSTIAQERLWGLSVQALQAGNLVLPDQAAAALRSYHQQSVRFSMIAEMVIGALAELLQSAGVEWRLLKGFATARLLYPDPSLRDCGDIDLLVPPADFERTAGLLEDAGWQPLAYAAPGEAHRSVGKERTFIHPTGVEIDLHRHVQALNHRSQLSEEFLFAAPTALTIDGIAASALSRSGMFIHACLHLASRETRASTLADVIRFLFDDGLDLDGAFDDARREGVAGYVDWAIERAAEVVDLPARVEQARRSHQVPLRQRVEARYSQTHPSAAMTVDLLNEPNRFTLVGQLLWPSKEFLEASGRSRARHLGHLASRPFDFLRPRRSRIGAARRLVAPPLELAPSSGTETDPSSPVRRRRLPELQLRDAWQLPFVMLLLLVADIGVRWWGVPQTSRLMRTRFLDDSVGGTVFPAVSPVEQRWLKNLRRVVARWPFDATCLRRSLVTGWVLRRHSPLLVIGVRKSDTGVESHAWIRIAGIDLDETAPQYVTY
jgi:hypothetical protein